MIVVGIVLFINAYHLSRSTLFLATAVSFNIAFSFFFFFYL